MERPESWKALLRVGFKFCYCLFCRFVSALVWTMLVMLVLNTLFAINVVADAQTTGAKVLLPFFMARVI